MAGWLFVALGTVLLSLIALLLFWPLSLIFEQNGGRLPHAISGLWARMISRALPFWELRTEGLEKIEKGRSYVIVSNHQSLLDILVLLSKLPLHFKFIAKRELFWVPFLGWHLAISRYICLRRGDPLSGKHCMEEAGRWLRRGVSVLFFPEGTRSPDGKIHEFKAGAFKVALEESRDLLPIVIGGTRKAIPKHSWRVQKRSRLSLKILDPVSVRGLSIADLDPLRRQVREKITAEFHKLKEESISHV